jgi:hypothetical protein
MVTIFFFTRTKPVAAPTRTEQEAMRRNFQDEKDAEEEQDVQVPADSKKFGAHVAHRNDNSESKPPRQAPLPSAAQLVQLTHVVPMSRS